MAYSTRTTLIISASAISIVLIGSAYVVSGPVPFFTKTVDAESTHDLLVTYAAKDTDTDGLPDWEEALYGTDPDNAHSVNAQVTDGEAVNQGLVKPKFATATTTPVNISSIPGVTAGATTVTDQFSRKLFEQYLSTRGATPPTQADIVKFVEAGVGDLKASQVVPDAFNQGQIRVSGEGPEALTRYAADLEKTFAANTTPTTKSEVEYFSDAVNKGDAASLAKVTLIGTDYQKIAQAMMKISVPKEAAAAHLGLANSLMHMSDVILDLASIKVDPLRAMIGLSSYENTLQQMARSLSLLNTVFDSEAVVIPDGATGSAMRAAFKTAAVTQNTKP
ncbi:MAG: thrombospondin type 3 repeat-containing protein [Patescibacteria group bacterium]